MCLLFFSYKSAPGYKLVLAANRDEFQQRPTEPLNYIDQNRHILAGLDLQGGGTWLGINKEGKIAALTNYREGKKQLGNAPSRGEILCSYLDSKLSAEDFLCQLGEKAPQYNGFNLLLGEGDDLFYFTNKKKNYALLEPGFYGLSNHFLDTAWPKVVRGKELLHAVMVDTDRVEPEKIFAQLRDNRHPPDGLLPDTGIGFDWERLLGTIFIESPGYGTRSSAVVTVGDNGEITFTETTYHLGEDRDAEVVQFFLKK